MIIIRNYNPDLEYLEQKEYGIIQDIYHSGLKRTGKKWIGRVKSNISGIYNRKAAKEIVRNRVAAKKAVYDAEHVSVKNKQPLYDAAKEVKTRVNRVNLGDTARNNFTAMNKDFAPNGKDFKKYFNTKKDSIDSDIKFTKSSLKRRNEWVKGIKRDIRDLKESGLRDDSFMKDLENELNLYKNQVKEGREKLQKLQKNRITGRDIKMINKAHKSSVKGKTKSQIFVSPNAGDDVLGHELGHQMNAVSKNPITRWINKTSKDARAHSPKNSSLKEIVKDRFLNKAIEKEERNASKNSIKLLKKSGAPKEEIRKAKNNLNAALDTYKANTNARTDQLISKRYEVKPGMQDGFHVRNYHTLSGKRKKMIDLYSFGKRLDKHYGI